MKKIIPYILFLIVSLSSFGQVSVVGSKEYGRLVYLNYDKTVPNRIYAATGGNHIVVSNDNGITWNVIYSYPDSSKQITLLKIKGNDELSFVLDDGYSNNNMICVFNLSIQQIVHQYFIPIPANSDESEITSYSFYNDNILMVQQIWGIGGSRMAKVYYTATAGSTWNIIYDNQNYGLIFPNGVEISPDDPNKLFIARQGGIDPNDYGGFFISNNAGQTWVEKLSGVDFGPIAFQPTDSQNILLGSTLGSQIQNLYRSEDGGENWHIISTNWSNEVQNGVYDIKYNPLDEKNIIVLGWNEIVRTYNNFETYEVTTFPNQQDNPDNYYYGSYLSFNPFQSGQILITNNDYPLISNDGGVTVSKIDNPFFYSLTGQLSLFKNSNHKHLYYSVLNGFSHRDMNTQVETSHGTFPIQSFPFTVNKFFGDENIEGRIYGFFQGQLASGIGVSSDHGANIYGIASPMQFLHDINAKPNNPNIILCSLSDDFTNCSLFKFDITDFNNVQQSEIALPVQGFLSDIYFDRNLNEIWICLNQFVYKSSDFGASWQLQSIGLETLDPNDRIHSIIQDPINIDKLIIATTKGIFTSNNHGDSWTQIASFEAHKVKYSEANSNNVVAITYQTYNTPLMLSFSNDAGNTWTQITNQDLLHILSDDKSAEVDFNGSTADVYIGTYDLGVLKYTYEFQNLSTPIYAEGKKYHPYPNPANSIVYVKTDAGSSDFNLSLFDNNGRKIKEVDNTDHIDIQEIQDGVYFLKILSDNHFEIHKIIKN